MQPMQHQIMGYDRAITMFSPDGRLLQVEYAKKTVKLGNTAMGVVCKEGVLLVCDKRIASKLVIPESVEKIFVVDDHIIATAAGIMSDARVLIERAREKAQSYRVTYDSPIDVITVVKEIADLQQYCTQSGGLRPFGVSILLAGVDENGRSLYVTEPHGLYTKCFAVVVGEGEDEIEPILEKEYKEGMSVDEALKMCLNALKKVLNDNFSPERIDAMIVNNDQRIERIEKKRINSLLR